ncbi:MAG: PH domain-containing protein [bacterium]
MRDEKIERIKQELRDVGIVSKTLISLESKNLVDIIYDDEHIGGAVHGTYTQGIAWLIATNKRIIFMDKKPFFKSVDEISYDVVSGTKTTQTAFSGTITLHTRMGDYTISFVKNQSAKKFTKYIEEIRLGRTNPNTIIIPAKDTLKINNECLIFLREHNLGVLSTFNRQGSVNGATVYYLIDKDNRLYLLTKSDSDKSRNILTSSKVSFTIYDEANLQTAQINGDAAVETSQEIIDYVFETLSKPRKYKEELKSPPVNNMQNGLFIVIKITPSQIKYHDFNKT